MWGAASVEYSVRSPNSPSPFCTPIAFMLSRYVGMGIQSDGTQMGLSGVFLLSRCFYRKNKAWPSYCLQKSCSPSKAEHQVPAAPRALGAGLGCSNAPNPLLGAAGGQILQAGRPGTKGTTLEFYPHGPTAPARASVSLETISPSAPLPGVSTPAVGNMG